MTRVACEAASTTWLASAADLVLVDLEELWDERQPRTDPARRPRRTTGGTAVPAH